MYSSLMANAWGFGSPASRGYRPSRRSQTWLGVLPAGTSMRTLGAPIASRYDANDRTEIHIMNRFYQGSITAAPKSGTRDATDRRSVRRSGRNPQGADLLSTELLWWRFYDRND